MYFELSESNYSLDGDVVINSQLRQDIKRRCCIDRLIWQTFPDAEKSVFRENVVFARFIYDLRPVSDPGQRQRCIC